MRKVTGPTLLETLCGIPFLGGELYYRIFGKHRRAAELLTCMGLFFGIELAGKKTKEPARKLGLFFRCIHDAQVAWASLPACLCPGGQAVWMRQALPGDLRGIPLHRTGPRHRSAPQEGCRCRVRKNKHTISVPSPPSPLTHPALASAEATETTPGVGHLGRYRTDSPRGLTRIPTLS